MIRAVMDESKVAEQWDGNADRWARQVRAGGDLYRELFNNPSFFEFAGDLSGLRVLDAGCGEGYNTRQFARRGARMIGIDLSPRMIELAREEEAREPLGIGYEIGSYSRLDGFEGDSFDAVVSTMALMDGPDFAGAMRELRRVLKPAARLCFSILHPCFITKELGWMYDAEGRVVKFTVGGYFDDAPSLDRWRFKGAEVADAELFNVPRFPRTLSHYLNSMIDAGLIVERVEEPRPGAEESSTCPWLQRWRDHVALFLYVRARKP